MYLNLNENFKSRIFSKMESNDFERLRLRLGFEFESNTKVGAFYSLYKSKAIHHYKNKCMAV
jgi:hypothetical protein